ncbi:MAG: putative Zn-dependent hydrolase of the beta-lactamase fold [Dehalococcoidales bacterium]|nr:putative Zn-dependent hydrolase of the beta-lactamase fold [Dehalococcoidales bacterium]
MKVKWLGHASFLITSNSGTRIITDPYKTGPKLTYGEIKESADVVTVSHEHGDHNNAEAVGGKPQVIRDSAKVKGIQFKAIPAHHDASGGKERGASTVFCFEVDGVKVCHLGDLGRPLTAEEVKAVGKVDVLLTPVGGFYTIDAQTAAGVCDSLSPKVTIPMHFKNDKCDFPISGVDDFLEGKKNVLRAGTSEVEFKATDMPEKDQILLLGPAL